MSSFHYQNNTLFAENVSLAKIATDHGTPCYVYSRAAITQQWHAFDEGFARLPHLICYAVKANSNLAVLNILARLGSGFDIVSGGELARVIAAGGDPQKIVFSGVGKKTSEIIAALEAGIFCFNVESAAELTRINEIASQQKKCAPIAIRVNPDVDAQTHPYISTGLKENKFGVAMSEALELFQLAHHEKYLNVIGIACHIGSQITSLAPFLAATECVLELRDQLEKLDISISHLDLGGGLGVRYAQETPPKPAEYAAAIAERFKQLNIKLLLEPGRAIVAKAGVLLAKVEYLKNSPHKDFAILDTGMNDLIRPAMYQAHHDILPVQRGTVGVHQHYDIVGPICETGDFIAKNRDLILTSGDILAIMDTGAYGFTMSSNYNTRARAVEIMVDGEQVHIIRDREHVQDLWKHEHVLP
ncbi:MAG: diaminopimelate decarboxylase [Gammaproteobacteria bacterium]|nr:diaminopimelate decarboxylase [Gammaproteobacteria bacterium]